MMAFVFVVFLGVTLGLLCAILRVRYPALVLLPLGALLAAGTALSGILLHAHPGTIAAEVFGSVAASQLTYVAVSLTHHLVRWRTPPSHLIPHLQAAAIGRELRTHLEVSRGLPAELSELVAQMEQVKSLNALGGAGAIRAPNKTRHQWFDPRCQSSIAAGAGRQGVARRGPASSHLIGRR